MAIFSLENQDIYYEVIGSGEPLVCIGGFTADHTVWNSVVPILSKQYQLILFDNPGSGQSNTPDEDLSISNLADIAIKLCDHLDIKKAFFLGNSMGGAIVQQIAFSYPNRVKKVVISNSFVNANALPFSLFAKARQSWFDSDIPQEAMIHAMLPWAFSGKFLTKENIEILTELNLNNPYPQTKKGYAFQLKSLLGFDSSGWLKYINVPCLFIASDEDAICFSSQIKKMAGIVKNSEYILIEEAGHLPHIEQAEFFMDKLSDYLRR